MEQVIIGVDPHKLSATIEVVDHQETRTRRSGRFNTDRAGYAAMLAVRRGVAGPGVGGRGRQRRRPALGAAAAAADGESGRRRPGEAGRAGACCSTPVTTARPTPTTRTPSRPSRCAPPSLRVLTVRRAARAALRLLVDRRDALSRRRVQTVNRLHRAVGGTRSGTATRRTSPPRQAKAILATVRPRDVAGKILRAGSPPSRSPTWSPSTPRSRSPPPKSSRRWSWRVGLAP